MAKFSQGYISIVPSLMFEKGLPNLASSAKKTTVHIIPNKQ
jgi:hypothetical protein